MKTSPCPSYHDLFFCKKANDYPRLRLCHKLWLTTSTCTECKAGNAPRVFIKAEFQKGDLRSWSHKK